MFQNVQPDWSENDASKESYILNKPVIPDDLRDYLCFTALQADSTVALNKQGSPVALNIEYSTDRETWASYTWDGTAGTTVTLTSIGDKVWFRTVSDVTLANTDSVYYVFAMTGKIGASGNLMSLMYKDFENAYEAKAYQFFRLFDMCPIVTPPKVPATKLGEACYKYLFRQCSILESAPELPATTLADMCYQGMFVNCASLAVAPELPATTMVYRCYNSMLAYTGITDAPYLRATTVATDCYRNMLNNCLNLKRIRTNQTSWANNAWLTGSSVTGVIECPSALDCSTRDTNHVPAGWTIVRYDAPQADWTQTDATEASYILNKPDLSQFALSSNLASVALTGNYADLTSTPDLTVYAETTSLASVALTGDYADLLNTPDLTDYAQTSDLASVALTGDYNDLTSTPDISAEISNALASAGALTSSDVAAVALSGDYADLLNTPDVSAEISSALSNAGALTSSDVAAVALSGDYADLSNTPDLTIYAETTSLASVALTGNYNDLTSTPDLTNFVESSTLEAYTPTESLASVALTGDYNNLTSTPDLTSFVTSDMMPDMSLYLTSDTFQTSIGDYARTDSLASVALTGDYSDISNTPDLTIYAETTSLASVALTGDYGDLTSTPDLTVYAETASLASVALTGNYADLTSTPDLTVYAETTSLASVALTGDYADLSNTPDISAEISSAGFLTSSDVASAALTGDYQDLTCKPNVEIKEIDSIDHTIYYGKQSNGASPRAAYIECISGSTYVISAEAPVAYMDAAVPDSSTYIGYNEVILDYNSGATISGDSNVSIVDALTVDKRNICVARWDPMWEVSSGVYGGAKLYVVITEDLPQA